MNTGNAIKIFDGGFEGEALGVINFFALMLHIFSNSRLTGLRKQEEIICYCE